jgi:hypothetical protein
MWWGYIVARVGLRRNAYRILVVKYEGKKRLRMFRLRWANIEIDLKQRKFEVAEKKLLSQGMGE